MDWRRRDFLGALGGAVTGTLITLDGSGSQTAMATPEDEPTKGFVATEPLRIAFLTDTHLPDGKPQVAEHVEQLASELSKLPAAPQLVVFGGDNVFAVDGSQSDEATKNQFKLWQKHMLEPLALPSLSVIGNHDIRWKEKSDQIQFAEKQRAIDTYGLPARFYAKSHGGWNFVMLDVFQASGCEVDEAQWEWLVGELKDGSEPVCVVTHAPLFSITHFLEPSVAKGHAYQIPASWSPKGLLRFRELFRQHPRVKLVLSGHMHTIDRVDLDGVSYLCGGAVSGAWWGGEYLGFPPAWLSLTLHPDGSWQREIRNC